MKPFWKSKLNLLGILTFVAGAGVYANKVPPEYGKYILGAAGIATVVLRTFFTSTAIGSAQ